MTSTYFGKSEDTLYSETNMGRVSQAIREKCSKGVKRVWGKRKVIIMHKQYDYLQRKSKRIFRESIKQRVPPIC